MTEEKKEEIKPEAPASVEKSAEAPKADAPAAAPAQETPQAAPAAAAPAAAKKEEAPVKAERPDNCAGCKKSIKKKRWYYRDGKYYCTKRCWSSANKKAEKPQEAAPAS
jgi:hypothetical protein